MNINFLGTQSSTHFYIPIPPNLTAEGILAYILLQILNQIKGYVTDENGNYLSDENGKLVTFDNTKLYPEMPLTLWRERIVNDYYETQIVFLHRVPYAN